MEFIVGITLALFICGAAAGLGMDRERVFHPVVLMATATHCVLFAVIDGGREVLWSEMAIAAVFLWIRRGRLQAQPLAGGGGARGAWRDRRLPRRARAQRRCAEWVHRLLHDLRRHGRGARRVRLGASSTRQR